MNDQDMTEDIGFIIYTLEMLARNISILLKEENTNHSGRERLAEEMDEVIRVIKNHPLHPKNEEDTRQ